MKSSKRTALSRQQVVLHVGFLVGFVFEAENGDDLSSEMSAEFHQTTWCNIQDIVPLHGHLKSSTQVLFTCSFNDDLSLHMKSNMEWQDDYHCIIPAFDGGYRVFTKKSWDN